MFKERIDSEIKRPRYWHRIYKVSIEKEDIKNWDKMNSIKYVGEFTDSEWIMFIEESEKNEKNEPTIKGQRIDEHGNPIIKKERVEL
jgi:hypothetical protein